MEELPHVAAWREAYRAFGAKPQRTRNSLEALLRRAESGMPRVNRLTDLYNAISVLRQVPLGGEDTAYDGAPRLLRATRTEAFDTVADGEPMVEHPSPVRSVVRRRRRHVPSLELAPGPIAPSSAGHDQSALFILDALRPMSDEQLTAAADELVDHLRHSALTSESPPVFLPAAAEHRQEPHQ